jgi:class 3 adenylate cyclase
MGLKQELESGVRSIFADQWETRNGIAVPASEGVPLGNVAVLLDATVLYADLAESTAMVDRKKPNFAAEVYKAYLHCAAKLIRDQGGEITAYDGDRIMGVFLGSSKNTSAAKCGLMINWAVREVLMPALKKQYPSSDFILKQVVGIDASKMWVARTGVRGANDLVWVGPAANYAAKLTELDASYPTRITQRVYDKLSNEAKVSNGKDMWEARTWTDMGGLTIYRSNWWWPL